MTPELFFALGIFHALVAVLSTSANLYVTHRRASAARRRDGGNLRIALAAELASLASLHRENIETIYAGRDVLISSRMVGAIYRGNVARIQTLAAEDIPALVAAYAVTERAEAYAAAHCKAHGATAFSMAKDRPYADALVAMYEKAAAATERALRTLAPAEAIEPAEAAREQARLAAA